MRVHATTVYVNVEGSNPVSPYGSWATAATTIQEAIDVSVAGDIVLVADRTYDAGGVDSMSDTNQVEPPRCVVFPRDI